MLRSSSFRPDASRTCWAWVNRLGISLHPVRWENILDYDTWVSQEWVSIATICPARRVGSVQKLVRRPQRYYCSEEQSVILRLKTSEDLRRWLHPSGPQCTSLPPVTTRVIAPNCR